MKSLTQQDSLITEKVGRRIVKYNSIDLECAERMYQRIKMVVPYAKAPKQFALWADTLRKMQTIDNLPLATIGEVFRWANQHSFWSTNILSPDKLRQQFPRLHAQMLQEASKAHNIKRHTRNISIAEQLNDTSWAR